MKRRYILLIIVIAALCVPVGIVAARLVESSKEHIISSCSCDLDNDGITEEILLEGSVGGVYGDFLSVRSGGKEIGRSELKDLKPWKVQAADVDGDGKPEISIGVFKTAKFDPVPAKRPFIYNWDRKNGLTPKWLGTRLSRPFDDYVFSDIDRDGMDELVSIEHLVDGRKVINSYKWKGFGFEGMGESGSFEDIRNLKAGAAVGSQQPALMAEVKEKDNWAEVAIRYENGVLKAI